MTARWYPTSTRKIPSNSPNTISKGSDALPKRVRRPEVSVAKWSRASALRADGVFVDGQNAEQSL
jgi:hypothetical protein